MCVAYYLLFDLKRFKHTLDKHSRETIRVLKVVNDVDLRPTQTLLVFQLKFKLVAVLLLSERQSLVPQRESKKCKIVWAYAREYFF